MRPGHPWLNLNPFEVLQLHCDPVPSPEEVTKRFRRLSIKIHPDKNQDDYRAPMAFDYLNKAYKMLVDDESRSMCERLVEAAREDLDDFVRGLKQRAEREGRTHVPEEEPEFRRPLLHTRVSKLFAKLHNEKSRLEAKDAEERKRQREMELTAESKRRKREEFEQTWDAKRDVRVSSWRNWSQTKLSSKATRKPPRTDGVPDSS